MLQYVLNSYVVPWSLYPNSQNLCLASLLSSLPFPSHIMWICVLETAKFWFIVLWSNSQFPNTYFNWNPSCFSYCCWLFFIQCLFATGLHLLGHNFCALICLLSSEPLWWTVRYFLIILVLILTISNLPTHLCVHLYAYLFIPPTKGRYIRWLWFQFNYHTLKLAGTKIPQWIENLEKLQFIADTEPSFPAPLASFSYQLCTGKVLQC